MSIQPLLDQVPFVAKTGVQCESFSPGRVVLSLPLTDSNKNHLGTMHAAALFTVAETAGGAACATHPRLKDFRLLARSMDIKFKRPANGGVTAHASIASEMAAAVERDILVHGKANLEVPIQLMDGYGELVAVVIGHYHFRPVEE